MNKLKIALGGLGALAASSFAAAPEGYKASDAASTLSTS